MRTTTDPLLLIFPLLFLFGFPLLADPNLPAKTYLFYFVVLFLFLRLIRSNTDIHITPLVCWWFGLIGLFAFSAFFSSDPTSALVHSAVLLAAGFFFIMVRHRVETDVDFLANVIWILALTAVLFALLGLYQYHDYLLHGRRADMLIPSLLPSTGARLTGPIGQPNFQATVMLIGLCCLGYLYKVRHSAMLIWQRLGVGLISILLLLNFFLTNSRSGYLSLICSFILLYVYARYRYRLKRELMISGRDIVLVIVLFAASWSLYWLVGNLAAPFLNAATGVTVSVQQEVLRGGNIHNRLNMWVAALLMAVDYPVFGVGLDNFKTHLAEYQISAHALTNFYYEDLIYTHWAHNEYMQVLAEGGIVGFVLMLGFLLTAGWGVWNNLRSTSTPYVVFVPLALVPLLVHAGFEWPLRFTPMLATFLLLIAISLPKTDRHYNVSIASPVRKGAVAVMCLALIGVGAWALYWDMEAGLLKRHIADEKMRVYNLVRMEKLADNPVTGSTILRQGIHPFLNYAIHEHDVEMARYLVPIMERIIHLEGASWQWYQLSRLQLTAGYLESSMVSVKKALHLNPIHEPSWQLQHYLNMVNAADQTGRPIESFFSPLMQQDPYMPRQ